MRSLVLATVLLAAAPSPPSPPAAPEAPAAPAAPSPGARRDALLPEGSLRALAGPTGRLPAPSSNVPSHTEPPRAPGAAGAAEHALPAAQGPEGHVASGATHPAAQGAPQATEGAAETSGSRSRTTQVRAELDPAMLPPSLSAGALREELRAASRKRQEELAALAQERARLEKLAAEIESARVALKTETAQLAERLEKAQAAAKSAAPAAAASALPAAASPTPKATPQGPDAKPPAESLAKTLKGMKPGDAAAVLTRLDRHLAVDLLRHMRPADAGGVLEKMKPETAAELFALLAEPEPHRGTR